MPVTGTDGPRKIRLTPSSIGFGMIYPSDDRTAEVARKLKFGQRDVRLTFAHGPFAGRTIGEVAQCLRAGSTSPDELPIGYIIRNGEPVALNNRSLAALRRAGMDPTVIMDRTRLERYEYLLDKHLAGGEPSNYIRIRGGQPGTSCVR